MISIAICDDDQAAIDCIKQHIQASQAVLPNQVQIQTYRSGKGLCDEFEGGQFFDLIFLDIEMCNWDGITVGRLLREKYGHDSTLLIYISNHTKYHSKLFDVQPFQFIQKPVAESEFSRKFKLAVKKIESGNEIYRYQKGRAYYQVKKKDIIVIESKGHNIILSVSGCDNIEFRGVFKEELPKLNNSFFIRTHVAYLVNINHVQSFHATHLVMDNGNRIPISEHRIKEVKRAFLNFGE